jgi:hypothetical protein
MPFGTATLITNLGKAMFADRIRQTPATYPNAPRYAGIGTGATAAARTAAVADVALSTPVEARVAGAESVVTTTVANDTMQNVATFTATAARAVDEYGLFDAATAGNMFLSATFPVINLAIADSVQFTAKTQLI